MIKSNVLLLTLVFSFQAQAFTLNNSVAASFDMEAVDDVVVNVASHTCTNIGLSNADLLGLISEAVDEYWNRVHTSSLRMRAGAVISVAGDFQTGTACTDPNAASCTINSALRVSSGVLISCNTNGANFNNNGRILGVTVPNNVSGQTINGSLILLNDIASSIFGDLSRREQVAVIAHEIGHAIGLGHTELQDNLMLFESVPTREALGWDDVEGVSYLYPVEQPISGCGTIEFPTDSKGGFLTLILGILLSLSLGALYKKKSSKQVSEGAALL